MNNNLKAKTMGIFPSFPKLSSWYRLLLVASIIWIIIALIVSDPWTRSSGRLGSYNNWDDFLSVGILPVVILWGIIWMGVTLILTIDALSMLA
jgi:hypothetical protein